MAEQLGFRPHARLLTMLGDQLIKNERVALVELIKNSYDADATSVRVDFQGFDDDFSPGTNATLVITDNGVGMTEQLVRTAWMNPATPSKALVKRDEPQTTRGRVLQGEKGIGRFATFKLGAEVTLTTRAVGSNLETTLVVDITALNEDPDSERPDLNLEFYLDQVAALMDSEVPAVFDGTGAVESDHGTQLRISGIRAPWNARLVHGAYEDLERIQPLMWGDSEGSAIERDFEVRFFRDGVELPFRAERNQEFEIALDRSVLTVKNGRYDEHAGSITFTVSGHAYALAIDGAEVRGLRPFRDWFLRDGNGKDLPKDTPVVPACGSFGFEFFIFDLSSSAPARYALDSDQKGLVKSHRIYLYRDNIRVYPYGDADDDWLEIDVDRGTEAAGRTLGNDQTVGYVTITQAGNPSLRDKTSREGLIETGRAIGDFKALIKTVLRYLRSKPYDQYVKSKERSRAQALRQYRINTHIEAIRQESGLSSKVLKQLDTLETAFGAEQELAAMQLARTEQLAGVGLSVETASHDLVLAGTQALNSARHIVSELRLLDLMNETVFLHATNLVTQLEFISSRFRDVQGLFVSTRQKQTEQNVVGILRRVRTIYARLHGEQGIDFEIDGGADLRVPSTEAAVLQLLINLVDNATFWLMATPSQPKVIRAFTPDPNVLVITDSGPGVSEQDAPFVFEAFYSGKGEEGKGLGLYIARQNGLRNGFSLDLRRTGDSRELGGATFVVTFGDAGDQSGDS